MSKDEKIKKWLADEMSENERKEFEDTHEFKKIDRLLKAVQSFKAPAYNVEKEYSNFSENHIRSGKKISLFRSTSFLLKVAAVVVFVVITGVFSYNYLFDAQDSSNWVTDQKVVLPDSSIVFINAGSKIRYSGKSWDEERQVELQGEAFYRVTKGAGFSVKTNQGLVTVLGTEFGVKDRENYYEVTCYEGSVKVVTEGNNVVLEPSSVYRIINKNEERFTISNKTQPDWLKGESSFNSVPLGFVLNELERQYKISVETSNVDVTQRFTGSFMHQNLDIALESITFPVNLDYKIIGNKVEISVEGN